ncbi:hypothetical protein GCM10009647_050860 [Streptomyces sanglieri]
MGDRAGGRGEGLGQPADLDVHDGHRLGRARGGGRVQGGREHLSVARFRLAVLADPRDRRHHHRVAAVVGQGLGERVPEVLWGGGGGEVEGRARAQPLGEAGVVREEAERLGVAEDRDPGAGRKRLVGEEEPRVDHLGHRVDPDHARLPHQRRDRRVRDPADRHRVAGRGGTAVPGALHHDHRLHRRRAPREAGELAGVAERFQVQQGDVGVGVLVPVLEEVVARDVGTVARGDEGGQARAAPVEPGEQRDADRSGLGEQADASGGGRLGGERGVQPDRFGVVDHAEGVRADDPHPVRTGLPDQFALPFPALGAPFGVSGGEHHQALDAVLAAVRDGFRDPVCGDGDDREVDRLLDLADRGVGGDTVDGHLVGGEGAVHGVRAAGEAGSEEVAQDRAADSAGGPADADDGDRAGGQQALHGPCLRPLFTAALDGEGLGGRFEVQGEVDGTVLETALLGVPGIPEHLDHLVVGGQHLGGEAADAALAGDGRDVFEQRRGHAPALVRVLDEEGDLGLVGGCGGGPAALIDAVVANGRDELAADRHGEPHPVDVVVMGEAVHVPVGQPRVRGEEPVVLRLVGDLLVEADQPFGIVRGDGPDARGASVAEHHVRFPVVGISVMRTLLRRGLHGQRVRLRQRSRRSRGRGSLRGPIGGSAGVTGCSRVGRSTAHRVRDWSRQLLIREGQNHG